MKEDNFRIWVVCAGLFNIIAAFPLSIPFTMKYFFACLNFIDQVLGFNGQELVLPNNDNNLLWLNTCGLALFLVGTMLLYASKDLKNRMGIPLLNGLVRILFAMLVLYYSIVADISGSIILIAVIDMVIGGAFLFYYLGLKRRNTFL